MEWGLVGDLVGDDMDGADGSGSVSVEYAIYCIDEKVLSILIALMSKKEELFSNGPNRMH